MPAALLQPAPTRGIERQIERQAPQPEQGFGQQQPCQCPCQGQQRCLAEEQQAQLRRRHAYGFEQADLGAALAHCNPGHVHDQDACHQQADRGNASHRQGQHREYLVEGAEQAVLADQGNVLLTLVTLLERGEYQLLATVEKARTMHLDKHPRQPLAIEQGLCTGHRDDQHLGEIHPQRFAPLTENADHPEAPVAGAQPFTQGRASPEQFAPEFAADHADGFSLLRVQRR